MQSGDMVYYLYTGKNGTEIKYPALIVSIDANDFLIRVGRLDVLSQQINTFESSVSIDQLLPRSTPCSYESELNSQSS